MGADREISNRPVSAQRATSSHDGIRDETESIVAEDRSREISFGGDDDSASDSLARGTHNKPGLNTKIESPAAKIRTSPPEVRPTRGETSKKAMEEGEALVGSVLGSYKILGVLGRGGMGYVFRAEHVKLGREVALKLLRTDYARRRDSVARFFQEARTVNRARHRNIVDVTDFVELEDGTTFIIMELLNGQSMTRWAKERPDYVRCLAVLVQICDGLTAAHAVGVVHRDLKPDNIFVTRGTESVELVKLLDFGVAKLIHREDDDVGFQTAAGSVIGTPAYMSPEQAGGTAIDGRADLYSLGAIMYELFCGQTIFKGKSFGEYVRKHLTEVPPLPRHTPGGASIDERIEAVIMRCLEKDPNRRYATAGELRQVLVEILASYSSNPPEFVTHAVRAGVSTNRTPAPVTPSSSRVSAPARVSQPSAHSRSLQLESSSAEARESGSAAADAIAQTATRRYSAWWLVVGGLAGVGVIAGGVVLMDGTPAIAPPVANVAVPAVAVKPTAVVAEPLPTKVSVQLTSVPAGATVLREGSHKAECVTPCELAIDLADGGSMTHRPYEVQAAGFRSRALLINVQPGGVRQYHVALTPASADDTRPAPKDDGRDATKPERKPKPGRDATPQLTANVPAPVPETPPPVSPQPVANPTPAPPAPTPTPTPRTKIRPSDTKDPFSE